MPSFAHQMPIEEVHVLIEDALRRRRIGGRDRGIALGFVSVCRKGGSPSSKQEWCARRIIAELSPSPQPSLIDWRDQ